MTTLQGFVLGGCFAVLLVTVALTRAMSRPEDRLIYNACKDWRYVRMYLATRRAALRIVLVNTWRRIKESV